MRVLMSATDVTSPSWGQNNPTSSKSAPGRASQARPISRPWGQPKTPPRHPTSLCSSSLRHGVVTFQRHTDTRTVEDFGLEAPICRGRAPYHLVSGATCRPLSPQQDTKTAAPLTAALRVGRTRGGRSFGTAEALPRALRLPRPGCSRPQRPPFRQNLRTSWGGRRMGPKLPWVTL